MERTASNSLQIRQPFPRVVVPRGKDARGECAPRAAHSTHAECAPRAECAPHAKCAPHAECVRICLRCRRPVRGCGYRTFYGVFVRDEGERIPAYGEPLHDRCPDPAVGPPGLPHAHAWLVSHPPRGTVNIAPGIDLKPSGRYAARANRKRLGTYDTLQEAQAARDAYLNQVLQEQAKPLFENF